MTAQLRGEQPDDAQSGDCRGLADADGGVVHCAERDAGERVEHRLVGRDALWKQALGCLAMADNVPAGVRAVQIHQAAGADFASLRACCLDFGDSLITYSSGPGVGSGSSMSCTLPGRANWRHRTDSSAGEGGVVVMIHKPSSGTCCW